MLPNLGTPPPGWTPGAYGIWVIVAMAVGYAIRQYVPWFKANTEREQGAMGVLQALTDKLQTRIDALEEDLATERKDREADLREERRRCDEETRSLHDKIEALQRIIVQWQVSTGRMLEMGASNDTPRANEALQRVARSIGNEGND